MHPRRISYINICNFCGKDFHPYTRESKYCSNECKGESKRMGKEIACSYCGLKTYKKRKWFGVTKLFYCSKKCKDLDSRYTKASNELKSQAQSFIKSKIKNGELLRKPCEVCGEKGFAHHYKGYEKKNWLDIKWLCSSHHSLEHQNYIREKHI